VIFIFALWFEGAPARDHALGATFRRHGKLLNRMDGCIVRDRQAIISRVPNLAALDTLMQHMQKYFVIKLVNKRYEVRGF